MKTRFIILSVVFLIALLLTIGYLRSGLLNLPEVPGSISDREAGLHNLSTMAVIEKTLNETYRGEDESTIRQLETAVQTDPDNLVLGNLLRMKILKLKREWIRKLASRSELTLEFPELLQDQPIKFFRELVERHPSNVTKLQLSLTLVDHMLLFPALEIKAPSSVEAVEILTDVLKEDPYYVPALYARGLNYLYRPFNLVWPEKIAAPPNAASDDLSLCVAVGEKTGAGSDALKSELSLALGDAYAKEQRFNLARSWWQIANNIARTDQLRERVFKRLTWNDNDVRTNLEDLLQHQMEDLDHPLSDLRFMWQ